jgi:hypothetical protein
MDLGIGAGWKRDEWLAYGYGFPETKERLAALSDHLEVITRMLVPGRTIHATYEGRLASVANAINMPKPVQQPRVPIMVGGNGQNVTWRLAAKHADELNVDGMSPDDVRQALPVMASRCEEIGRDPATLPISVHLWWGNPDVSTPGQRRVDMLGEFRELGVSRVMALHQESARSDDPIHRCAEDVRAAGAELAEPVPA